MLLEYIACKVSRVRAINHTTNITGDNTHTRQSRWLCGTYGAKHNNQLSLWCTTDAANEATDGHNRELKRVVSVPLVADVTQINVIDNYTAAVSQANGQVLYLEYSDKEFRLRHKWDSIDGYSANDSVFNPSTNELITCGDNGVIRVFNLDNYSSEMRSKCLTQNSLKAIDLLSRNEVICGTSSGHLKVYDYRNQSVVVSMANELSVMTCVGRNPNISHLISCGNDVGVLSIWDLRNSGRQLLQVSAHSALVSQLNYKANEPNVLMTSSYDGSLLRWNISSATQLESVDAIVGREGGSAINSFDINSSDEIMFTADNEVLYLGHL